MNSSGVKRTFDAKRSEEPQAKSLKLLENMNENLHHMEKYLEFSREILNECYSKLEQFRSQMSELESVMGAATNNTQHDFEASKPIEGRNRLENISYQKVIEEITLEGGEKPGDSDNTPGMRDFENRRKKQKANEKREDQVSIIIRQRNTCTPGPSKETTKFTKSNRSQTPDEEIVCEKEDVDTSGTYSSQGVVKRALRKTKGVLAEHDFNTFLYLCHRVQDPVQLAKISFTIDLKMLYLQLMQFHFYLKIENDDAEKETGASNTNRKLEDKVRNLIQTFQEEIER